MGKIKAISRNVAFWDLHKSETLARNESNDCCVKALSLAGDISYADAHAACAKRGRKNRHGMYNAEGHLSSELKSRGFAIEWIDPSFFIKRYPGSHKNLKGVTSYHPIRFASVFDDGNTYIMFTRNHAFVVRNGETVDWSNNRMLRVTAIMKVSK